MCSKPCLVEYWKRPSISKLYIKKLLQTRVIIYEVRRTRRNNRYKPHNSLWFPFSSCFTNTGILKCSYKRNSGNWRLPVGRRTHFSTPLVSIGSLSRQQSLEQTFMWKFSNVPVDDYWQKTGVSLAHCVLTSHLYRYSVNQTQCEVCVIFSSVISQSPAYFRSISTYSTAVYIMSTMHFLGKPF